MTTKTPAVHVFNSVDPFRRNPHNPRCCDTCGLPETRVDVHTLPAQSVEVTEAENRRYADRTEETE